MTVIEKLTDLHKQATVERSHFYVGKVTKEAIEEISTLTADRDRWKALAGKMAIELGWAEAPGKNFVSLVLREYEQAMKKESGG